MARIFGIDPHLDRCALCQTVPGLQETVVPSGTSDHPFHKVYAGNLLGYAMLHLQPGVHFQKEKVVAIRIIEELHSPGGAIIGGLSKTQRRCDQRVAGGHGKTWSRSFLNDLLIAAL